MSNDGQAKIKTSSFEYIKTHAVLDGTNRITEFYEVKVDAIDGDPCIRTRYQYFAATSNVTGTIEEDAVWDSTWDF